MNVPGRPPDQILKKGNHNMTDMTAGDLDKGTVEKAYDRWAPVYDLVFGAVFDRGRQEAIAAAERIGGRILEVGVGTGISLPAYPGCMRITGIDISAPMLRQAAERVAAFGLTNIDGLLVISADARVAILARERERAERAARQTAEVMEEVVAEALELAQQRERAD